MAMVSLPRLSGAALSPEGWAKSMLWNCDKAEISSSLAASSLFGDGVYRFEEAFLHSKREYSTKHSRNLQIFLALCWVVGIFKYAPGLFAEG